MKIGDGYLLMLPGFVDKAENQIVLYDVQSMLNLQKSEATLTGYPGEDLPVHAWGTVNFSAHKMLRWVRNHNRLIKVRLNSGGTKRITYSEPKEWQKFITPEQWQWLMQISEVFRLQVEEKIAKHEAAQIESEPVKPKKRREKKPKVKAKIRRKMSKRELVYGK